MPFQINCTSYLHYSVINLIIYLDIHNVDQYKSYKPAMQGNPLLQKKQTYKSKLKISLIVLNIALSSFYFGYAIVYFGQLNINTIKDIFNIDLDETTAKGVLNGCTPVGALVGALASSFLINKFSRRKCLLLLNVIALVAGGFIYVPNFYTLLIFRFWQGFCVGAYSSIAPLIIKEMSPNEISGTLGSYTQLLVCTGVFFGCIFKYILYKITGDNTGQQYWFITFGFTQITVGIQTIVLLFVFPYQTPKYLLSVGKDEEAKKLIQLIYKQQFVDLILQEKKADLALSFVEKNQQVKQTIISQTSEERKQPTTKLPIVVAIHLAALQQLSGINAIAIYGGDIASKAVSGQISQLMSSLINFEQVLATFVTGFLLVKFGRKTILQYGTFFEGVGNLFVAIGFFIQGPQPQPGAGQYLILIGLFLYMAVFGLSLGPIVWLYIPEIVQPKIIPFSTATNWICASLIIILFPILTQKALDKNPAILFCFFTAWCFASYVFNWKSVIQTKDKTQKAIQEQYSTLTLC